MNPLPVLGNKMFLADELSSYVRLVNKEHSHCLDFAKRLNELAHKALFSAKVVRTDLQHILLIALLQRAMTAFQAAILLLERGLPQEGQVALRTLLEVTFKTVAIAKHPGVAETYVLEDETLRRKLINKYKLLSPGSRDVHVTAELDSLLRVREDNIREKGVRELTTQWFAERAELLDFYNTAYAVLSTEVHVSARTLERALNVDSSGEIANLKYGFSDESLDHHVLTAAEAFIFTLRAAFTRGDIPSSVVEEIHAIHQEFDALHKQVNGEA